MAFNNVIQATSPTSFTDLQTAITTIGSQRATLKITNSLTITANITIPENVSLEFMNGAILTVDSSILTVNGPMTAGNYQIFDCKGTGKVNGNPVIDYCVPHWWKSDTQTSWDTSLQAALNFSEKVFLPEANYFVTGSLVLSQTSNHIIFGTGYKSLLVSSTTAPIFKMVNTTGYPTEKNTCSFEKIAFQCINGIQINEDDGTAPTETKQILNVKITGCYFYNQTNMTGATAINLYEVFDSSITENYIYGFNVGICMAACDINFISNNRIMYFKKYAIWDQSRLNSSLQFGSQNQILHNDVLIYDGIAHDGAFIKSNSLHIIIRDNFLENGNNTVRAFVDCSNVGMTSKNTPIVIDITGNRCSQGADYTYLLPEDFRSLHLTEAPMAHYLQDIPKSSFCKNSSSLILSEKIPVLFQEKPKGINIENVFSFREWSTFSTTPLFETSSNGGQIISPKNIPYIIYQPSNRAIFSPKSFIIENGNPDYIWFQMSQLLGSQTGELNSLPKRLKIKIIARNLSPVQTSNTDFYIVIQKGKNLPPNIWQGYGTYSSHNTSSAFNNYNTYTVSPDIDFDSTSDYHMLMVVSAPTLSSAEIKNIIIEPTLS